ncbi:MAG: hypothetical protein KKF56_00665 [Nanoarchaeota archaeon]|nr:hypothetical protein [Nanoarchaeota archaeon]
MIERNEGEGKEKSDIEKALALSQSYKDMSTTEITDGEAYQRLRALESAYQELQRAGREVRPEIRERQYQILEAVLGVVDLELDSIRGAVHNRNPTTHGMSFPSLSRGVRILSEYCRKLFPSEELNEHNQFD